MLKNKKPSGSIFNDSTKRLSEIVSVFLRHGFGNFIDKMPLHHLGVFLKRLETLKYAEKERKTLSAAQRVRLAFEELGPTFIKLGQLLSTRQDILDPEYIEEFKKLQDNVGEFPFAEVEKIIQEEMGETIAANFAEFEQTPCAAASIAQVHLARLHSGEKVAVKVQRPGIEPVIRQDVKIMYRLAHLIERNLEDSELLDPVNIVAEFEKTIFKELDFTVEAANIEKFRNNFKGITEICTPKVYWEFCSQSVMVVERLDGLRLDDVDGMRAWNIDPKDVALIGLRSFAKQILEDGFFHADAHPANSMVLADGRIALIDFGIIGYLDDETMRNIAELLLGFSEHDYDRIIRVFFDMGLLDGRVDLKSFRRDLIDTSEPYYGRSLKHIRISDIFNKIISLALKHRIMLPHNLLLLLKTLVQIESMGCTLYADANILETLKPYARRLLERIVHPKQKLKDFKNDFLELEGTLRTFPGLTNKLLRQLVANKQRIEIFHLGFENIDRDFGKGVNRLTVGVIISATLIAAAQIINSQNQIATVYFPSIKLKISLTTLLGLIGYHVATILGVWLIISIIRSSKL